MDDQKNKLLRWIDEDRDRLIDFLSRFIQAKSPNPPGDTRAASNHICQFLEEQDLPYQIIAPQEIMPNIVGSFDCGSPGRHLVLNGHIDVFPVGEHEEWTYDPWGGTIAEGRMYGRGGVDMKSGITALIFTFAYLNRIRDVLSGRLTLTCVSDEETFGPWGARYLMSHHPMVQGDCCLSGETSSPYTVRYGEKGFLWLVFTVRTPGAHSAYPHLSSSATKIAGQLMADLETLTGLEILVPKNIALLRKRREDTIDKALGKGAAEVIGKVTVNIGTIHGGLKVNMVPGECMLEVDIRLPIGLEKEPVLTEVEKIVSRYPEVSFRETNYTPPSFSDPNADMVYYLQANAKQITGIEPKPITSLGATDCRLWRYQNIPAYVYGLFPTNQGAADEYLEIEEFINTVKVHVLSAYDYLTNNDK